MDRIVIWAIAISPLLFFSVTMAQNYESFGCFEVDTDNLTYHSMSSDSGHSVSECVKECRQHSLLYAALHNERCFCNDTIKGVPSSACQTECIAEPTEMCGGVSAISIYETHQGLGSPGALIQVSSNPTSIHIRWLAPEEGLNQVLEYLVTATPIFTYAETGILRPVTLRFSAQTNSGIISGVQPATKYEVRVQAASKYGLGYPKIVPMWSAVGVPQSPQVPEVISRTETTITVTLSPVVPTSGPISTYQVVVSDGDFAQIVPDLLYGYKEANSKGLPYYITAEFPGTNLLSPFTVGDNQLYGGYKNVPLRPNGHWHIVLGVTSALNCTQNAPDCPQKAYSDSPHSQHGPIVFAPKQRGTMQGSPQLVLGLSIAIGVTGALLAISIFVYISLRIAVRKNRMSSENQELSTHAHVPNLDSECPAVQNGYNGYNVEEDCPPNYYTQLKERVCIIPHQNINVVGHVGLGKFGQVSKGVVIDKGNQRNALIQRIEDDSLAGSKKTQMLRAFDSHVRLATNPNVVSLIGLMEEFNVISVAFEYEPRNLKTMLVESRALQHYPVYAEKNRRFSTLSECQAIDILIGICKGMNHLTGQHITHGQLCARNIAIVDGTHPKITGFGLTDYSNELYTPDYRRWQAIETLRNNGNIGNNGYCPPSDIWSFGCLIWEVCTLGGTPYSEVRTDEVAGRVARGLRLPQPQYVGDELYQVLLDCWQHDPSERPNFMELEGRLQDLVCQDIAPHLLFSLYPSFQYQLYAPHLEFVD